MYSFEDFKESLNHMSFLKKLSYELYTGKPFAWKDMLSALSLFSSVYTIPCCLLCRDVVIIIFISLYHQKRYVFFFIATS